MEQRRYSRYGNKILQSLYPRTSVSQGINNTHIEDTRFDKAGEKKLIWPPGLLSAKNSQTSSVFKTPVGKQGLKVDWKQNPAIQMILITSIAGISYDIKTVSAQMQSTKMRWCSLSILSAKNHVSQASGCMWVLEWVDELIKCH